MKDDTKHLDDAGGFDDTVVAPEQVIGPNGAEGPYEYPIKLQVSLTAAKLVAAFGDSGPDDVRTLIIELDQEVGLWSLSILLYRYFEAQMSLARVHCPHLVDLSDEELMKEMNE